MQAVYKRGTKVCRQAEQKKRESGRYPNSSENWVKKELTKTTVEVVETSLSCLCRVSFVILLQTF